MSSRQQATGSLVIDDRTASALADVFAALDWEDAILRDAAAAAAAEAEAEAAAEPDAREPTAAVPGIVFGEPVGHGTIRLHGRDPEPEPAATVALSEPVSRDPEPEPEPQEAEPVARWEPVGHGTIRLRGRER